MSEITSLGLFWFILGIVFLIAELFLPGFIIMFFGVGALITALLTQFGIISSFNIQIIVFIASSVISLLTFRKRWSTYFSGNVSHRLGKNESIDDIKGKRARVINTITPGGIDGKVEFNGTNWDADAEEIIQSGEIVVIEARNNLRLIVKRSTANENKGKPESE
ncbi:MAG: NfeD family protein [Ignavibacteriaceae bacterium]|jgi:Membrane protein implicated in regulation of membrane protease activity|nr:MAG: hypothetical protein UZ04_CHB001000484 [Chlorobi bacterium OLB4]MBW7854630.1 NfeD family protein [Ignavibacteria bacterium]MEB2330543.1 NfeD family protein [Ignavibacteriaceae bacterium]OQY78150.1 MAG: hypothetical protein B6D43_03290 [Ignavibacteriales bacterium UTCHB1]